MINKIPAAGYVRCSTEMQEDSPDQQKKEILKFAETSGYEIIEWFEDFGKSGTTFIRPEFQRLLNLVERRPQFRAVIIYDESRWGRAIDAEENTYWRVHFRRYGVEVVLVKTTIDPKHEFAPMLNAFEGVQASLYSKKLSALTFRGSSNNGIYSSGGTAPYGYRRIAINLKTGSIRELDEGSRAVRYQEKVRWELGDPAEVAIVKRIFDRRIAGIAYVLIAKELNDEGISCPKRGRWRNRDQKWNMGTIKSILENEAYYGCRVYNKNSMSKIRANEKGRDKVGVRYPHWVNPPSEWIRKENAHPAIISKDTWLNANAKEDKPKVHRNTHSINSSYLLTGLIKCNTCGFPFQGQTQKVKGHVYPKYIDGGYQAKRVCKYFALDRERVEKDVYNAIRATFSDPEILGRMEKLVDQFSGARKSTNDALADSLGREIASIEKKKENILDTLSLAENELMRKSLMDKLASIDKEKSKVEIKLAARKAEKQTERNYADLAISVKEFMLNFETEFEEAPTYHKKEILRRCLSGIVVDHKEEKLKIYVRPVPAVNGMPMLEAFKNKNAPTNGELVGAASSGART